MLGRFDFSFEILLVELVVQNRLEISVLSLAPLFGIFSVRMIESVVLTCLVLAILL